RPSLGQVASLGSLYDAKSDAFVPLSLVDKTLPQGAVKTTRDMSTKFKYSETDSFKHKFGAFGVDAELGASFLAGLVEVTGSARYLSEIRTSELLMQSSLRCSITTVHEKFDFAVGDPDLGLVVDVSHSRVATHVVAGITWGASCVIAAKRPVTSSDDRNQIADMMAVQLNCLQCAAIGAQAPSYTGGEPVDRSLEVTVYSDVPSDDGFEPTDLKNAKTFLMNMPKYIASTNNGKGIPLLYTLVPLSTLRHVRGLNVNKDIVPERISLACLIKSINLFDQLQAFQRQMYDYHRRIRAHPAAIPPQHLQNVIIVLETMDASECEFKANFADALKDVRARRAVSSRLWDFLDEMQNRILSAKYSQSFTSFGGKMDLVDLAIKKGARYVGKNGPNLDTVLLENNHDDAYIMYLTNDLPGGPDAWREAKAELSELLHDGPQNSMVIVVDCEATHELPGKVRFIQMRKGQVIIEDVVEHRKSLMSSCIMRYNTAALDRDMTSKPLQRRALNIPCPWEPCADGAPQSWICSVCYCMVEYAHVDKHLYCECGACPFDQWEYRCKDPKHGRSWVKYDGTKLLPLLKSLEPCEELNILILGETGVGKSTWINAFINFLTYGSLQEALSVDTVKWKTLCSFQTQVVEQGRFIQKQVTIGTSTSENEDPSGQLATRETMVDEVSIGNVRVRLIDTTSLGDTRGVDQDKKNIAEVLSVLQNYNCPHNFLFLLKPNESHLTASSRFCIEQLLTHLNRTATGNIAFGFTNTRGSNFKPGDTFAPLEKLLRQHEGAKVDLHEQNVYCFDSESFRFLAAHKKGIDMGFPEVNARSWERSVAECKRLVKHFQEI
ncbi:hypothetical protein EDB81DRAFT_624600, partial [Dactylonectria macrodidyma]